MEYVAVSVAALVVSALTLFSGFGLGTLLMPVFAIFFPVEVAIASTAIVHLANNLFKVGLVGKKADIQVVFSFAIPAIILAFFGAYLLTFLSELPPITEYGLGGKTFKIMPIKMVIAVLIFFFALFELLPYFEKVAFSRKYLPLGGALSGFFGGLSGHQGALRSAFLIKAGLEKEAFIGTGVVCAVLVDFSRLIVYGLSFLSKKIDMLSLDGGVELVIMATIAAFLGSVIGTRLVKTVTMKIVRQIVGGMLLLLSISLGAGWV